MDWDKVGALSLAYGYYTQLTRLTRCDLCLDPLPGGGYALKATVERAMASYGYVIGCFKVAAMACVFTNVGVLAEL